MMHTKRLTLKILVLLFMSIFLSCCGNSQKREALEAYVQQVESRPAQEIAPLPKLKIYHAFIYKAMDLRSPFVPSPSAERAKKAGENDNGIHPDLNRPKEVLEYFPLDSLRMVGTLEKNNTRWALVIDPRGTVYRLAQGNYAGQNHGRIDEVMQNKVLVTEIVPDPAGGWRERKASMALVDEMAKTGDNKNPP